MSGHAEELSQGPAASDESRYAWARYWHTGALHSCATSFDGNYEGPIAEFWRGVFAGLLAADQVLDVGCGNGPLAKLLIETRPEPSICCSCVDLAPVAPDWLDAVLPTQRQRVRFFGGTRAEAMPFADGRFALAISQFGLEYSDLAASVPELLRVLARPSRLAAVVHHVGSHPVRLAGEELRHVEWVLQAEGLIACAFGMLRPMALAATEAGRRTLATDAAALQMRERFNAQQRELSERASASFCPDLLFELRTAVASVIEMARTRGEGAARAALHGVEQAVRDNGVRLRDMRNAAMDETRLRSTLALLTPRAQCEVARLEHAGHLMGWSVRAALPAAG